MRICVCDVCGECACAFVCGVCAFVCDVCVMSVHVVSVRVHLCVR